MPTNSDVSNCTHDLSLALTAHVGADETRVNLVQGLTVELFRIMIIELFGFEVVSSTSTL